MNLFTNANKTLFYNTDEYVKNITPIEVSTIQELVFDYKICSPKAVLNQSMLITDEYGAIEELRGFCNDSKTDVEDLDCYIDFIVGMSKIDIAVQLLEGCSRERVPYDRIYVTMKAIGDVEWEVFDCSIEDSVETININDVITVIIDNNNETVTLKKGTVG